MTTLQQIHRERLARQEAERLATVAGVERLLGQILPPNVHPMIFGSLARPYRFDEHSDIDVALDPDPGTILEQRDLTRIAVALEEAFGRRVDLIILQEVRDEIRERILHEALPCDARD